MNRNNSWTILFAGIGIGAAAGILLARCSGADLRKALQERAGTATNFLRDQAGTLVDKVSSAAETGHDRVAAQVAKSKDAARSFSKSAKELIDSAAGTANKVTNDLLDKSGSLTAKAGEALNYRG